jgi:hypothetical protein
VEELAVKTAAEGNLQLEGKRQTAKKKRSAKYQGERRREEKLRLTETWSHSVVATLPLSRPGRNFPAPQHAVK